jgi:hypothetical protein
MSYDNQSYTIHVLIHEEKRAFNPHCDFCDTDKQLGIVWKELWKESDLQAKATDGMGQ